LHLRNRHPNDWSRPGWLSLDGYRLSRDSIARANDEAQAFGVARSFAVADVRDVASQVAGPFDVVLSGDNSLPHLLTDADLTRALANMHQLVRPGGLLIVGIRYYDAIRAERPRLTSPQLVDGTSGRSVLFQLWD
jgi:SAM-dependent methyltransferase